MKISKYFNIDPQILIEYIYDDSNLIGEPYNILFNNKTDINCFVSSDEDRPTQKGYKQTNNDLYNQLYRIDGINNRYGNVKRGENPNTIDDSLSFLQIKNFSTSIPIRYDTIKVHMPIEYTFENKKGFYIRVFTYDFNNSKIIDLSNYYFNITDIEQNYKLEYSPVQIINQQQWGKFIKIQIPATTKVSDQRVNNITKSNSINYNLTNGTGLSTNSPIFIEFSFIESIEKISGSNFFNLSPKISFSVPQTPEFEKLGVKIEESNQGDYFLIYGTYNGTLGDFEKFIDQSYYEGNRYYLEFKVDLFEKNVKTKTNTFILTEDFGDEIEYRPILKFTTTTAVIDVTLRLIDSVNGTYIERMASYGMLQGGGSKMGSLGGGGDISKYSRNSTKINLKGSKVKEVYNIKSTIVANVGDDPFGTKAILKLRKIPFNLFSNNYYLITGNIDTIIDKINYTSLNKTLLYIYPFDNIVKIEIKNKSGNSGTNYDLTELENIKLVIKSDSKSLEFEVYRDSSENDFENGKIVFKIGASKYFEIKEINKLGFDVFYIVGYDSNGVRKIVYNSFYLPWDSSMNINKIQSEYIDRQKLIEQLEIESKKDIESKVKEALDKNLSKPKGVNQQIKNNIDVSLQYRWMSSKNAIELGSSKRDYSAPKNLKDFEILLLRNKLIKNEKIKNIKQKENSKSSASMPAIVPNTNDKIISLILGYFKGLNINPTTGINFYFTDLNKSNTINSEYYIDLKGDLNEYIKSGLSNKKTDKGIGIDEKNIVVGEFLPINSKTKSVR